MKFLKHLDPISALGFVGLCGALILAGCEPAPAPPPEPTVRKISYGFSETRLDGCQYIFSTSYHQAYCVHKGNCDNPIHGTTVLEACPTVCSWYGEEFSGRPTASGELFDTSALTCASNRHRIGTRLLVTAGGRSVVVRVNDRMSKKYADRLDLSPAAFQQLAPLSQGLVNATVEILP